MFENAEALKFLKTAYKPVQIIDEEFTEIVAAMRKAAIKSKALKIPQLKILISSLSELRVHLVFDSDDQSENEDEQKIDFYSPK